MNIQPQPPATIDLKKSPRNQKNYIKPDLDSSCGDNPALKDI